MSGVTTGWRIFGIIVFLGGTWTLQAQDDGRNDRVRTLFEKFDTNRDGKIDSDEYPGNSDSFKRLDRDGDGVITKGDMSNDSEAREKPSRNRERSARRDESAGREGRGKRDQRGGNRLVEMWIKRFDLDRDGSVSRQEFEEASQKQFKILDEDGDGVVEREEVQGGLAKLQRNDRSSRDRSSATGERTGERSGRENSKRSAGKRERDPAAMFAKLDKNGDGVIEESEFPRKEVFGRLDKNADGQIDKEEFETMTRQMMQRGKRRTADGADSEGRSRRRPEKPAPNGEKSEEKPKEHRSDPMDFIRRHDLNGDGVVDQDEYSGPKSTFERHDTNQDGKIDESDGGS
ncbi:MAG: EF-hand domain-containing protein [Planctomycetota bacterium]|nr:EF-hand domain-containing protein [Planctomycetota bacterium]